MQGDFWMGPSINQFRTCRIQFKTKMYTEFFLNFVHKGNLFFKNMQKIKKEEIRLTWPQTFSVVSTLPLLKIAHFVGHICLFIFLDAGKVPPGQIKHLPSQLVGLGRSLPTNPDFQTSAGWRKGQHM